MPRGPKPEWTRRKEPVADDYILASVNQAGGPGKHDPATGQYTELVLGGLADRDEAREWVRALYRSALWLTRHQVADVSVTCKIERGAKGYRVKYKAIDKTAGRAYVLERHGSDRTAWPYDPRKRIAS